MTTTEFDLPTVTDEFGRYDTTDLRIWLLDHGCKEGDAPLRLLESIETGFRRLAHRCKESDGFANAMSADLSAEGAKRIELVEAVIEALCEAGGWQEIDGDGTELSIIPDHIRWLGEREAPRWWNQ